MSFSAPMLTRDQIEEVRNLVHGILEDNKRIIDDVLSELVDIESTNILGLYNLVVEQWQKKQKVVDNLCHFSLTMMATVQLLWDQKFQNQDQLNQAKAEIDRLKKENQELAALNQSYQQQIHQSEVHNSALAQAQEKLDALSKCQSCINFSQKISQEKRSSKKCGSCGGHEGELNGELGENHSVSEVESLLADKKKLEKQLQSVIEQSQLTKMQLQLAEIAIKEALAYKSSYLSLIQSSASRISEKSRTFENADYLNGDIECQSNIDDSFTKEAKGFLNGSHHHHEPAFPEHPINTICRDEKEPMAERCIKSTVNPFKKKASNSIPSQLEAEEEASKSMNLANDSHSSLDEFEAYRPESQIVDQRKINEIINRFKLKKSKISDRQETAEQSLEAENSLFKPSPTIPERNTKRDEQNGESQTSLSKFYNFITKKVVKNRIKHR